LKGTKGVAAHLINESRGRKGQIWQAESYDRIIRDHSDFLEKLNYMWNNPIKEGLAKDPHDYPGWFFDDKYFDFIVDP
jgi:REP element-mobilizing transposase RayT